MCLDQNPLYKRVLFILIGAETVCDFSEQNNRLHEQICWFVITNEDVAVRIHFHFCLICFDKSVSVHFIIQPCEHCLHIAVEREKKYKNNFFMAGELST